MKRAPLICLAMAAFLCFCLVVPAAAGTVNYTYDAAGRLIEADYGNGKVITYTYDNAGNLLQRQVVELCGDLNGDGVADVLDLLAKRDEVVQNLRTWIELCWALQEVCGDANGDGVVDNTDLSLIVEGSRNELIIWVQDCWLPGASYAQASDTLDGVLREFEQECRAFLP